MYKMKRKLLLLNILQLLLLPVVWAQVTVGSDFGPREGTLLDLKEYNTTGKTRNADKGLGLPRVALSSLTELTIDNASEKSKYVGVTVYNITNNTYLAEGTYCWFGDTWKQVVLMPTVGTAGNVLISNGNNTYRWENASIPGIQLFKPTQTAGYVTVRSTPQTYSYGKIVFTPIDMQNSPNAYYPVDTLFNNTFIYSEKLKVKSDAGSKKFMVLEITADINKATVSNTPSLATFWEEVKVDVVIDNDDVTPSEYKRVYSTPTATPTNTTVDLFKIIPLPTTLGSRDYDLKIRISVTRSTYRANAEINSGNFQSSNAQFLKVEMTDFGFVLYEEQ